MADQQVSLNGKLLTEKEFEKKKKELESKPGVEVKKVKEGTFRTKIKG